MDNRKLTGVIFTVSSAVLYGISAVLTKYANAMGLSVAVILIGIGLSGCVISGSVCLVKRIPLRLSKGNVSKVFILGLFGKCLTVILLNNSYLFIPVGTATTIHYLYPAICCIATAVLFKEKVSWVTWLTVALSFAGMIIMTDNIGGGSVFGMLLAAGSAFAWVFYMLYFEHSGVFSENKLVIAFYISVIIAAFSFVYGAAAGTLDFTNFGKAIPLLFLIGLLNNCLASVFFQRGVERIGAGLASILSVFEPISSITFGALIMKELLTARQIAGCVIILLAVSFLMITNFRKKNI